MLTGIFDLVNSVVEELESISANPWFYGVIFIIAYLDSIIPAVPSETTVILGGIAAGQGNLNIVAVILLGAFGAFAGDTTTYTLGRRSGSLATRWIFRGESGAERLRKTGVQIRKRGGLLLITARFIPGGRTALTFTCGLTGQPLRWFARWDLLAVFVWSGYAGSLGFFFGDRFEDDHTAAFWWAFGTALSISALVELVRFVRGRLRRTTDTDTDTETETDVDPDDSAETISSATNEATTADVDHVTADSYGNTNGVGVGVDPTPDAEPDGGGAVASTPGRN